jgi:hypothetical protein
MRTARRDRAVTASDEIRYVPVFLPYVPVFLLGVRSSFPKNSWCQRKVAVRSSSPGGVPENDDLTPILVQNDDLTPTFVTPTFVPGGSIVRFTLGLRIPARRAGECAARNTLAGASCSYQSSSHDRQTTSPGRLALAPVVVRMYTMNLGGCCRSPVRRVRGRMGVRDP